MIEFTEGFVARYCGSLSEDRDVILLRCDVGGQTLYFVTSFSWSDVWDSEKHGDNLAKYLAERLELADGTTECPPAEEIFHPIEKQEVWAAGVTYKRSKTARMEESETAASCYDRVYEADRPELFLKATPHRVVGQNAHIRIRADSEWDVPEPELTLFVTKQKKIFGEGKGNDVSSRSIEGDNPLYLPQAKVYDQCCAISPWIRLCSTPDGDHSFLPDETAVSLRILKGETVAFEGETALSQLNRTRKDLIDWLSRDNSFPNGVALMTGTGVVPESDFTLTPEHVVEIQIGDMPVLRNPVVKGTG